MTLSFLFIFQVINETLRLGNIVPGIFRGVTKDIEMKGTTIPAGSTVMVCPSAVHLNPASTMTHLLLIHGDGRLCAGAHFAKVQVAVFLHYLVTKYRWKKFVEGISFESLVWCFQMGFTSKSQQNISDQNKHFVLKKQ
ncbi:Cytochrome P450 87A3 [Vitis vinifera]|uniref:Cytochrome P450 87A3 n=1 Tax=Vitis vinifera TaxID=29760 RepID=A0A438HL24_VITVI|nr:Cytochrome P450 87A3 [Vitis vinifera]